MKNIIEALNQAVKNSLSDSTAPRFTYIIGNNGTGKSRILATLAKFHEENITAVRSIPCITNALFDRFSARQQGKIQYLGMRSTVGNAIFHALIGRQVARLVLYGIAHRSFFLKRIHSVLGIELWFEIVTNRRFNGSGELDALVDMRKIRNSNEWKKISAVERKQLISLAGERRPFSSLTKKQATLLLRFFEFNPNIVVTSAQDNGAYTFSALSSGEQNRILLALKILAYATPLSLIIIDEPEISLHLQWQIEFHSLLVSLTSHLKRFHVVIATHSPIIVSEAAKDKKTSDSIVVLEQDSSKRKHGNAVANHLEQPKPIEFEMLSSRKISSYDDLLIDQFDVATFNTRSISEKITDALISIAENSTAINIEGEIKNIKKLSNKSGIVKRDKNNTAKALRLISDHYKEKN